MTDLLYLGDQGLLLYFGNESQALQFANALREQNPDWLVDVVQSYASVGVFIDHGEITLADATAKVRLIDNGLSKNARSEDVAGPIHVIPCCYELSLDLQRVADHVGLSIEEVIELHLSTVYTVYAIGFCPGFPYLGYLPEKLAGVPRLESPRVRVDAGSVGLTGRQTGVYTLERPGGWNVIGKTPVEMVNVEAGYFPIRTGDRVRFQRIDEKEYRTLQGTRLNETH